MVWDDGVELTEIDHLAGDEGRALLDEVETMVRTDSEIAVLERLGRRVGAGLAAAALTQVRLRTRAVAKLGAADAGRMLFTSDGLEQATRARVATRRAELLATSVARTAPSVSGIGPLTDLGCGIGADLIAFARAGFDVLGIDRDPVTAACAAANLRSLGLPGRVEVGDVTEHRRPPGPVFCDPARRDGRGRVFDLASVTPPWSFVLDLLAGSGVREGRPRDRPPRRP